MVKKAGLVIRSHVREHLQLHVKRERPEKRRLFKDVQVPHDIRQSGRRYLRDLGARDVKPKNVLLIANREDL